MDLWILMSCTPLTAADALVEGAWPDSSSRRSWVTKGEYPPVAAAFKALGVAGPGR